MTQHLGRVLVAGLAAASALIASNTTQPTSAASLPQGLALEGHVVQLRGAPPTVAVGTNPISLAVDDETRTAYVATAAGVSVVDVSHCKVGDHSGCGQTVTTLPFGKDDIDVLVDPATRSVYVSSSRTDSVIVFGTARCNARDLSGCGGSRHRVRVGGFPTNLALDVVTGTLYVSNSRGFESDPAAGAPSNAVSMIDTATCNGQVSTGCAGTPPTVRVGRVPQGLIVDPVTQTLYVTDYLDENVSLVNAKTCNALVQAGCGQVFTVDVGQFPDDAVIDQRSRTLYVANTPSDVLGTLSMIDLTTCNVHATRGCRDVAPTTPIGTAVLELAADPSLRTIYAASQEDSSVSVIDERRCNATNTSGCRRFPLTMSGGFSSGGAAVDTATHTVYLSSQSENNLTVLDGTRCNGLVTLGCTRRAPVTATGVGPQGPALSAELGTLYVSNQLSDTVSVIDVHACSAEHLVGCRRSWPTVKVGAFPKAIGLDPSIHTAYVANYYGNSVSVVDTATCNAKNTAGCGRRPPEIAVPGGAYTLVVDPSTHTVYVAGVDDGTVSVIDGSTCNAQSHSGCDQTPTAVPVGDPSGLVLDQATRTLFVADRTNGVVSVLDADTCNGRDTSGCAVVATTPVGTTPRFMAVDDGTGTLYVANKDSDTLSLVDLATCSAQSPAGCGGASPAVPVGHLPYGVAVDHRSGVVYIGDVGDSTLASFETARCNAHDQSACGLRRAASTGGWPTNLVVDAADRTVYVTDNVDAQLSVVQAR